VDLEVPRSIRGGGTNLVSRACATWLAAPGGARLRRAADRPIPPVGVHGPARHPGPVSPASVRRPGEKRASGAATAGRCASSAHRSGLQSAKLIDRGVGREPRGIVRRRRQLAFRGLEFGGDQPCIYGFDLKRALG
jgi:hypothetical protein